MLEKIKSFLSEIGTVEGKYLVSCFFQQGGWKIDFYSVEKHKLYTYEKVNGEIVVSEDEVFQKEKRVLEELDLDKVKVSYEQALEKVDNDTTKAISILQVINGQTVWNITVLTQEFKVVNIRIDAVSGEVLSEKTENLLQFKKGAVTG